MVGILAGVDGIRRLVRGRVNTWTYVLELGLVGGALGVIFADDAGEAAVDAVLFFMVWAVGALLFDVWLERPRD